MGDRDVKVNVNANADVLRVMPQRFRIDAVRAARMLGAEPNRGILEIAKALHGQDLVRAITTAVAQVDQDAIFRKHRARVVEQVWDGETPINGCPPDEVRVSHNMRQGDGAYTIAVDGQVIVFQPVPGITDPAELARRALEHANEIAANLAQSELEEELARKLIGW